MKALHSEQDIRQVCEHLVEKHGTVALTRTAVQDALRRRSDLAGHGPVGADHATVGRVIRVVLDERRGARAAANESDITQAGAGEVPQRVTELLNRFGDTLREVLTGMVGEVQRRAEADAQARVQVAGQAAAARVVALTGELESQSQEAAALATDYERATSELDERIREVATLTAALEQSEVTSRSHRIAFDQRIGELEAELKAAEGARREATARAHAAELATSRLEATVGRLEERVTAADHGRDDWRESVHRLEAQLREVERLAEERRIRLELIADGTTRVPRKASARAIASGNARSSNERLTSAATAGRATDLHSHTALAETGN